MSDAEAPAGELDMVALSAWMQEQLAGGLAGPLTARLIAGGRSNPTYELTDGTRDWILRRPPYGEILQSAHDMSREATVRSEERRVGKECVRQCKSRGAPDH